MVCSYFFDVRTLFLKTSVIFADFRQLGNLPFSKDLLKENQIASAKKFSFALIILTGMNDEWPSRHPALLFL